MRDLTGSFIGAPTKVPRLAGDRDVSAGRAPGVCSNGFGSTNTTCGAASKMALIATIHQAVLLPESDRLAVLAVVADALPQDCVPVRCALEVLQELRAANNTFTTPVLRYQATMQLGQRLTDPRFGTLTATAGAEIFFHRFGDDLDAVSHVISDLPDSHAQAGKRDAIREATVRLAMWSGLTAPLDAVPVAKRAPLLEEFSRLLPQLPSIEERSRGMDCLFEKAADLPLTVRMAVIDNLIQSIGDCKAPQERLPAIEHIVELIVSLPQVCQPHFFGQLAATMGTLPEDRRQRGFDILFDHAGRLGRECSPDLLCPLIGAIANLPSASLQQAAWFVCFDRTNSLPYAERALPIVSLIGTIGVLPAASRRANHLAAFGPSLIQMEPSMRHAALLHMVKAIRQMSAGAPRTTVLAQTTLLMNVSELAARQGVLQLQALTGLLPYLEAGEERLGVLQTVVQKARGLPDPARITVLESVAQQFQGWKDGDLLKPAVLIISREYHGAMPPTKERLSAAITAGLLAVCDGLQVSLAVARPDTFPMAAIDAWFQAAAIAPAAGRTRVLQAAGKLIESGWYRNRTHGQAMLDAFGGQFSRSMQADLARRLSSAAR